MPPQDNLLVSIVTPFYNESEGVESFFVTLTRTLDLVPQVKFEFIFVDDGSRDKTLDKLIFLSQIDSRIIVIELSRNFGKEAALSAGLDYASGDAVIPIDSDLQDPPELIPALIETWLQGYDVVLAKRTDRSSDSLLKRSTAKMFYWVHNLLSGIKIPENVGDFRIMDRIVIDALKEFPERQRFMKGLFAWSGFRTTSIEFTREKRAEGFTKYSIWKLWNLALEGITSFSTAPLKVWTYLGISGSLFAFLYGAFILMRTLLYGRDVPGYTSLIVVILFLGSLQLISIGTLGEYIGRIYIESKQRPKYIIRNTYGENDVMFKKKNNMIVSIKSVEL
ncbi:glycosyltransferase family 2 protein [Chlorobium sp.]|jgi:glycosyltransferase involved in cell wall biosynthesis|uniref:glycosyltransferase family 2 protein n=1 Tax=Chlorobium sp. TaxID=1095 RepID=UPI003C37DE6E